MKILAKDFAKTAQKEVKRNCDAQELILHVSDTFCWTKLTCSSTI